MAIYILYSNEDTPQLNFYFQFYSLLTRESRLVPTLAFFKVWYIKRYIKRYTQTPETVSHVAIALTQCKVKPNY